MTLWDDRILELLREWDSGTPSELAETEFVSVSRQQVSRRLQKLAEHALVQPLGNGVYVITERGEKYLDGELSTFEDEPDEQLTRGGSPADTSTSSTENGV
ncbi:ArsR family transcriptional regulator [Halosimplex marinum]|uniref:ArsR family transcriptional regulator n=1 Tax=Halosimplex marinum TaxID=3396620 RepID=UPI003F5652DF